MKTAFIGFGSNLGDSLSVLLKAWRDLGRLSGIHPVALSSPYRTEPVGMTSNRWFVNAAGSIRTSLSPGELLSRLMEIEQQYGRERQPVNGEYLDRTLDLDILLYDQHVSRQNHLVIPHPQMHKRLFALYPLCEIAPDFIHPLLKRTMQELLSDRIGAPESYGVEKISWP